MPTNDFGHDPSVPITPIVVFRAVKDLFKWQVKVGPMITLTEAAEFLGVSRQRVVQLVQGGRVRSAKFGRNTFVPQADVTAYQKLVESGDFVRGRGNKAAPVFE
jgi:excisionase family DNA binding protein